MNLLHLHYFHVVAREGGFTNASKALRIQQPAISRMVRQLEESLGQPLFERIGRRVQLTTFGLEVFQHSQTIFGKVERLERFINDQDRSPKGLLAFAAAEGIGSHFVPEILRQLLSQAPELYPQVYTGPAALLCERILKGELEFGLFFHLPRLPDRLKVTPLRKVRFHLVVRKDLAKNQRTLENFIGSREIDDVETKVFPTLSKLKRLHPNASIRVSSNNLTAHRSMVLKGIGVSILPDFLIAEDLRLKKLVDVLPKENLEFDLKLVHRHVPSMSINAAAFLHLCS